MHIPTNTVEALDEVREHPAVEDARLHHYRWRDAYEVHVVPSEGFTLWGQVEEISDVLEKRDFMLAGLNSADDDGPARLVFHP